jgi:hypothetical protein
VRPGGALVAGGIAALALVVAASAVATRRQRALESSSLPTVENVGPQGLAAARGWLEATGRTQRVVEVGAAEPAAREVVLIVAPPAPLDDADARALIAHVEHGGLLVWAMGESSQPSLERGLGVVRAAGEAAPQTFTALAPHPLFDGLVLRTGGASLRATTAAPRPVAGPRDRPTAMIVPLGAGEAVVLADPGVLENRGLAEAGNLGLLARLAALGPIAFDERHLSRPDAPPPPSRRALVALLAQALLAAAVLLVALGRRLGDVRVEATPAVGRTARDYLASLAGLYRRAGAERELAEEAWQRLRRELERRARVPARSSVEEAAARLEPAVATALREAAAGREAGSLLAVSRAGAIIEASLGRAR